MKHHYPAEDVLRARGNAPSRKRRIAAFAFLLSSSAIASPAFADSVLTTPPPVAQTTDPNGVDILSGQITPLNPSIDIGDEANGLAADRSIFGSSYIDSFTSYLQDLGNYVTITIDGASVKFNLVGSTYVPVVQNGSTFTKDAGGYTLTKSDGTTYRYGSTNYVFNKFGTVFGYALQTVTYPSKLTLTFYYTSAVVTGNPGNGDAGLRLQSVKSSSGWEIHYSYAKPTVSGQSDEVGWSNAIIVTALNSRIDPCDPLANLCANTGGYPIFATSTATQTQKSYSDADNNQTIFAINSAGYVTGIIPPQSVNNALISWGAAFNGKIAVSSVANARGTTTYTYSQNGDIGTVVATNGSNSRTYRVDLANSHLLAFIDELGHETDYQYNAAQLLSRISYPKGNFDTFLYDARGNLTSTTRHPVAGSAMAAITTSAVYPSTCANPVTCNHPTSTTDGNGNTTDYTYDPVHGGVATVTGPAPTVGATRPQTRYFYTQIDSSGAPSSTGVFVLTGTSACATGSACAGTADETVTSYTYGANLLLSASAKAAGDGSISSSTAFTYDKVGNVIAQDGPLAGANDVTRYFYDADRQKTGTIYPDADGASPYVYLAERISYNARGNVASFDTGTVTDPTQAALTAMTPAQSLSSSFDSYGRKVTDVLSAGGTTYSLTQYSYDALSRPSCVATRMNPATFGSLPSDACTAATAGSFGPDLIRQTGYDAAGHPTSLQEGVGTSAPRTTSYTYNLNGNVNSITDPKGNVTAYVYDDFVRLYKVQFPSPTAPGSVSTTDYEQYSFDNNDNITVRRLRNGTTLTYGYDALNRLASKTPSSGASNPTSTYSYDLLNNMRSATAATAAHTVVDNFTYDALSRKRTDVSLIDGASTGTKTSLYDSAGRRTSFQLGNGFTTTYEYDYLNNLKTVREGGTTPLATFDYDNLGRRINRSYPQNGVSTAYTYNDGSDLTKLEIKGGTNPTTIDLGGYNPAGQIGYRTNSNDVYAWTAGANVNVSYVTNGLNQFTAVAGATQSYDLKGNLAALSGKSLTYGAENALMTSGTASFLYDGLGRLVNSNTSNRFDYDDDQLVAETNTIGTYARWYVAAPGGSEPLVWYEGNQTDKRYLDQDERGSIVRVTNASGGLVGINSYDEFGVPGPANIGRFQYTGQAWMPEAGLYYNRARMYAPTLGRFVQADPLGMQAGFNLYNYTSGDPINATDPSGLDPDPCTGCIPIVGNPYPPGYEVIPGVGWGGAPRLGAPDGFVPREALDRAQDAAKEIVVTARRTKKVLKETAVIVVDAIRTAQDDVEYALDKASDILVGPACCFTAGTLVSTPHGLTPIEQLRVGDLVMSRDDKTGQTAPKPIEQIIPAHPRPIWSVEVRYGSNKHETYETTADHPWRSRDHRWLTSAELTAGQLLETEHGTATVVRSIATGHSSLTYNLTVADFHTYFVGHAETWVHNSCEQPHKANSPVWKRLRHWRGPTKTDGKRYYEWDYTHHNIEVYNKRGEHIGVIDPFTAAVVGSAVEGREINVK